MVLPLANYSKRFNICNLELLIWAYQKCWMYYCSAIPGALEQRELCGSRQNVFWLCVWPTVAPRQRMLWVLLSFILFPCMRTHLTGPDHATQCSWQLLKVQTLATSFQSGWPKAGPSITVFRHLNKQHSFQKNQAHGNIRRQELWSCVSGTQRFLRKGSFM